MLKQKRVEAFVVANKMLISRKKTKESVKAKPTEKAWRTAVIAASNAFLSFQILNRSGIYARADFLLHERRCNKVQNKPKTRYREFWLAKTADYLTI